MTRELDRPELVGGAILIFLMIATVPMIEGLGFERWWGALAFLIAVLTEAMFMAYSVALYRLQRDLRRSAA